MYIEEEEKFLLSVTELKWSVIRKEGELPQVTHATNEKDNEVKEREEALKDYADNLQKGDNYNNNEVLCIL